MTPGGVPGGEQSSCGGDIAAHRLWPAGEGQRELPLARAAG